MQYLSIIKTNKGVYFPFVVIFLLLISLNINLGAQAVLPEDIAKLQKGEILTKSLTPNLTGNLKGAEGRILIQASPEKVWKILDDQEKLQKIIPRIKKVKVLEKSADHQKVQTALKVCPFLPTFKYTVFIDESDKYKKMKFNRIDGCFKQLYGVWELEPYKNSTILTYKMFVDIGFYIPPFVRGNGLNRDLPEILSAIRNGAENNS